MRLQGCTYVQRFVLNPAYSAKNWAVDLLYLIIDVYLDVYVLPKQHYYKVYVIGHCAVVFVRRPQLI